MTGFHHEAQQELSEAAAWYQARSPGLGERFIDEVEQQVELLSRYPRMGARWEHPTLDAEVRRVPLPSFPYLVVYTPDDLVVVAIAHGRRRPGYWTERL